MKRIIASILIVILFTFSCSEQTGNNELTEEISALQAELDSLKNKSLDDSGEQIATFLTFQENNAEEAMNFYIGLFENSRIIDVQRYGKDGPAEEGTIMVARFELNGSKFMCSDSYIKHEWDFTPGVSNWVDCKSDEEIEKLFEKLSENGNAIFPLGSYGFSERFAFVEDRFGISWQLNLN